MKTSEKKLVKVLVHHFKKCGFHILKEVRLYPREIDILLFDPSTIRIISIEVKLSNWRKAFSQAMLNKFYSHFSLIAIKSEAAAHLPLELLRKNGIGLIEISIYRGTCNLRLVEHALMSKETNRLFLRYLLSRFVDKFGEDCYEY